MSEDVAGARRAEPAGPTPRTRRAEVRRRLLDAAAEVFAERGYAEARLEDIARAAGFTKGAVYSNFGGKHELFAELVHRHASSQLAVQIAEVTALNRPATVAEDVAAVFAERVVAASQWHRLIVEFAMRAGHDEAIRTAYVPLRRRQRDQLAEALRSGAEQLGLELAADPADVALILLGLRHGLGIEHAADPNGLPVEQIARVVAATLRGLLRPRS